MSLPDDDSTSPSLLRGIAQWENHPAWARFWAWYDPLIRRWCGGMGLDQDSLDEVCQRIWIELAARLKTFQYDPSRSFRGWLRCLCKSRSLDFLRQRTALSILSLDDPDGGLEWTDPDDEESDPGRQDLLDKALEVKATVRARVSPRAWEAFWLVAVCDRSVEETTRHLGMTRVAVYAATARVARMLREEGKRLTHRGSGGS